MSTIPVQSQPPPASPFVPAPIEVDYDKFITEDDKPVDSWYCERQHRLLTDVLHASWQGPGKGRMRCVATDVGLFYSPDEPAVAPDVMISLDVTPPTNWVEKRNRSYFTWLMGKPPEMTIEVVSNTIGGELTDKMEKYARIGVRYYVIWDPEGWLSDKPLQCFVLKDNKYTLNGEWFSELELGVAIWDGEYDGITGQWLRFCDRQGANIHPTGLERANNAEQRAENLEQHAAKLAEKLRALGIDPDA